MERTYLGTDAHGYSYWFDTSDLYVYQRRPDGTWAGYVCKRAAWERVFSKLVVA